MSESPQVIFKYKRIAEGDWQIEAHYPGAEIRYIKGFKSKAEIDEWLQRSRRIDWLRSTRNDQAHVHSVYFSSAAPQQPDPSAAARC
jgi:hypothetical protein